MYEAPCNDDPQAREAWHRYLQRLSDALADDRRGDAVALFMSYVAVPAEQIAAMRQAPSWPALEALAPTLAYDHTALLGADNSVPTGVAARVVAPVLVMHGDSGHSFMGPTARSLNQALAHGELRTLAGQSHDVDARVLGPVLVEFLLAVAHPSPSEGERLQDQR